jgi:hypothetical protein
VARAAGDQSTCTSPDPPASPACTPVTGAGSDATGFVVVVLVDAGTVDDDDVVAATVVLVVLGGCDSFLSLPHAADTSATPTSNAYAIRLVFMLRC